MYIDWPSVLISNNVGLHQEPMTQVVKNICIEENSYFDQLLILG